LAKEIEVNNEKAKEKITRRRDNIGMDFNNKLAIKLFIMRTIMEKVGKRKREVAEANCPSPQGRE
jgi:hypothetical protein